MKTPRRRPGAMLQTLLRSLFRRPATTHYPYVPFVMPKGFRGPPRFHVEGCIGCQMCVRNCPARAITITKVGEKRFEATVDLGKCVYCGQCADSCPKKIIEMTSEFELAQIDKGKLRITYHAPAAPPIPEGSVPAEQEPPSG